MKAVLRNDFHTAIEDDYRELAIRHNRDLGILWYHMEPLGRPCFSPELLREIKSFQENVAHSLRSGAGCAQEIQYLVLASRGRGIFNFGGDLGLFLRLIKSGDRQRLNEYAKMCIDVLYANAVNLDLPVTTISLVQGNALGGGFEAAMSSNVLIAERGVQMGLPEILFNLFPGMGAYSFLSRRLDAARAERMILSGHTYTAEELYEMGLVDVLAERGQGEAAVVDYVKRQRRIRHATLAVHQLRQKVNPITYEELLDIVTLWVDTAMKLEPKDLRVMERLVRAQDRLSSQSLPSVA
jgi:DSF synthase